MTPFLPSCEGNGTSRLSLPVALNGTLPGALCLVMELAGFEEEEEIAAIDREGIRTDAGLTRSASEAADLVEDNIL